MEACGDEEEADVQTAIATVSLSGTLNEKLEAIAKAQFRGVEIFENDLLSFNGTPTEIRRMIEDLGLCTITFQPFRDFEGMLMAAGIALLDVAPRAAVRHRSIAVMTRRCAVDSEVPCC